MTAVRKSQKLPPLLKWRNIYQIYPAALNHGSVRKKKTNKTGGFKLVIFQIQIDT